MNILGKGRDFKIKKDTEKLFEQEFAQEILVSEKLKATALSIMPLVPCVFFICQRLFLPHNNFDPSTQIPVAWIISFFLSLATYEFTIRSVFSYYIKTQRKFPKIIRYIHTFIEVSAPTIALLIISQAIPPAYALLLPGVFAYFLFIFLSALCLDFKLSVFTGAVAALEYSIGANFLVSQPHPVSVPKELLSGLTHTQKGLTMLIAGIAVGLVANQIKKRMIDSFNSIEERNEIIYMFGQYVSPQVVNQLLDKDTDLRGELKDVCVMFLDIRGFTSFSENKDPKTVVDYLNKLFDFSINIVNSHNGIINKFLGDGFMAVFGAPVSLGNDRKNAVSAALEIIQRIELEVEKGNIPPTRIGIGIHAGDVMTGNVGSQARREYTIMGDVVNLASRIEQLNKEFHSQVLISETVWKEVGRDVAGCVAIGEVQVRGREELVKIYRLV